MPIPAAAEGGEPVADKIRLNIPVIVEGKYDKARLAGVVDAVIIPTGGFSVFNDREKRALIRKLGQRGLILLSDSDGGGRLIRSHLRGMLEGVPVWDLYTPAIPGKEPRKSAPSKAGILGVEGVPDDILRDIFARFAASHPECTPGGDPDGAPNGDPAQNSARVPVTKALLYDLGLNGGPGSAEKRAALAEKLGLPRDMTVNAFCAAADLLSDGETLTALVREAEGRE